MEKGLKITPQSDRDIVMTRVFDAPRELVFEAYTKPELLKRWLGVFRGHTMPVCEVDLRVGGAYRWVWRDAVLKSPMESGVAESYDNLARMLAAAASRRDS
jgi:uncharacterized protein YndB with AHSA1/START domain